MNRFKRLLRPLLMALGVLCAVVILGFVERNSEHAPITDLRVLVDGAAGMHFIDEEAVRREVLDQGVAVMGAPMGEVDMPRIEDALRNISCVAEAEAYRTLDGVLHVRVRQREPIVRVLNSDGSSFYIDKEGWTMPTDPDYTARVLVVTGALNEPGARDGVYAVHAHDSLRAVQLSDDIHRLALFIGSDPLWSALIDQVVVTGEGEFELIPRVGDQRVLIGDGRDLQQRFSKLKLFYEKGIPLADWRRYDRLDLRYADQIVCTKRTTP